MLYCLVKVLSGHFSRNTYLVLPLTDHFIRNMLLVREISRSLVRSCPLMKVGRRPNSNCASTDGPARWKGFKWSGPAVRAPSHIFHPWPEFSEPSVLHRCRLTLSTAVWQIFIQQNKSEASCEDTTMLFFPSLFFSLKNQAVSKSLAGSVSCWSGECLNHQDFVWVVG